jgi:hypothetical protein
MPYSAPLADFRFLLDHVVGFPQVTKTELFAEATGLCARRPVLPKATARLSRAAG